MKQVWKSTAMGIVYSLIIMMVASILTAFTAAATAVTAIFGSSSAGGFVVLTVIFLLAMVGGFVWFFLNLSKFITLQRSDSDRTAISNVRTAYILFIAGTLLGLIPVAGIFINLICQIVAYVLLIIAYGNFANSPFMNEEGRSGASLLKTAAIINVICSVLMIIPFINILAMIGSIVALVLLFLGWTKVSNGYKEEEMAQI